MRAARGHAPKSAATPVASATGNPLVRVNSRAVARVRTGHPWIYRSDVTGASDATAGAVVEVADERGRVLGSALYSSASVIALRMIARETVPGAVFAAKTIPQRIQTALEYRRTQVANSDAYRIIFSEADQLPGLVADRYNDLVTLQVLTQAFDRQEFRAPVIQQLAAMEGVRLIVERVDARIRALEKLPPAEDRVLWTQDSRTTNYELPTTIFTMNGIRFHYEALGGQKTGAFLDQRENYAAVERYAHGDALDCFCYHGGFALHLARRCSSVTGVDSSRPALEAAERNATLNGRELEWIEANAFDLLRDYADSGRLYDTIVLDPPAFAKSKSALPAAMRGYKELNLRALKILRPDGILATCSCSYHVSHADFAAMLASAAADSGRHVRILERRGASADHPAIATIPETDYLKCVLLSV
jgi:23S rRNA (cytosine1962-C5)-methyltransferase